MVEMAWSPSVVKSMFPMADLGEAMVDAEAMSFFVVDEGLRTLMDFRYNRHFKAQNGEKGMTKGMHGRGAEDLYVRVPKGQQYEMLRLVRSLPTWLRMDKNTLSHTVAVEDAEISVLQLLKIQLLRFQKMGNQVRNANSN